MIHQTRFWQLFAVYDRPHRTLTDHTKVWSFQFMRVHTILWQIIPVYDRPCQIVLDPDSLWRTSLECLRPHVSMTNNFECTNNCARLWQILSYCDKPFRSMSKQLQTVTLHTNLCHSSLWHTRPVCDRPRCKYDSLCQTLTVRPQTYDSLQNYYMTKLTRP